MGVCAGDACSVRVSPGARWCYNHDPSEARVEERRRNGRRGGKLAGRGRPLTEDAMRQRIEGLEQDLGIDAETGHFRAWDSADKVSGRDPGYLALIDMRE